jgi:hypothetical protein
MPSTYGGLLAFGAVYSSKFPKYAGGRSGGTIAAPATAQTAAAANASMRESFYSPFVRARGGAMSTRVVRAGDVLCSSDGGRNHTALVRLQLLANYWFDNSHAVTVARGEHDAFTMYKCLVRRDVARSLLPRSRAAA